MKYLLLRFTDHNYIEISPSGSGDAIFVNHTHLVLKMFYKKLNSITVHHIPLILNND